MFKNLDHFCHSTFAQYCGSKTEMSSKLVTEFPYLQWSVYIQCWVWVGGYLHNLTLEPLSNI